MPKIVVIIIVALIVSLSIYLLVSLFGFYPTQSVTIDIKGQKYQLEVAKTIQQKTIGLMNRTSLCPNCGMIFVSSMNLPQTFWMKNTLIPLDMIFIDANHKVVTILNAVPEPNTPDNQLKMYSSTSAAMFVIELNSGDSQKIGLHIGDIIPLPTSL